MGWKDILRPIRDGLRDNLPSKKPDDKDRHQAERKRQQDALRGFTYFESFQDLDDWHPDHVSSLQRANTPLLPRSGPCNITEDGKATITLVHDFAGNYHDFEAVQGSSLDQESFSCQHMQFVNAFVYFSHKLVCVPPPSWTNTLHRNGVKSLGTFLVEPQSVDMSKILRRRLSPATNTWEYVLASQLIGIARYYGFDGWLLNLEKTFAFADWKAQDLEGFIKQLNSAFGDGCIIWYDSLTIKNTINYQNGLTKQNLLFAKAAGSILTNYAWDPQRAQNSKALAVQHEMNSHNVLCGIDVWAQNSRGEGQSRKTYPRDDGGGTGTGLGVAELAAIGLSVGIFAPAWPYEHFPSDSGAVERSMWYGDPLPDTLRCECTPADRHAVHGYQTHPILKHAREYPAGSETFFYTNFMRAFETLENPEPITKAAKVIAHLGSQSILPDLPTHEAAVRESNSTGKCAIYGELKSLPPRATICMHAPYLGASINGSLRLFNLRLALTKKLTAKITYRKSQTPQQMNIWLEMYGTNLQIPVPSVACSGTVTRDVIMEGTNQGSTLSTGISVRVEGWLPETGDVNTLRLVEILEICIQPKEKRDRKSTIYDVVLDERDEKHTRLRWKIRIDGEAAGRDSGIDDGLPYSETTGPFSFFIIEIDGREVGKAFSLEYLLPAVDEVRVIQITGVGFDGVTICLYRGGAQRIQRQGSVESWQLV